MRAKEFLILGEAMARGAREGLAAGIIESYPVTVVPIDATHVGVDLDPPSYLPMREPLPPRRHDPNPDEHLDRFCPSCGCQGGVHHSFCKADRSEQ
jgi:hypothetical protein